MIKISKEEFVPLKQVSCIYYLLRFWKDIVDVKALIDSGSKVNAMTPAYTSKLDLKVYHTNVGAQKIDGSTLKTLKIVLTSL